jgi:Glycine zipper 2TM domain
MKPFRRSGIAVPLVAIVTALALPAQAEDHGRPSNAPPGPPVAQAARVAHPGPGHPKQAPGQGPHTAHIAHGPAPSHVAHGPAPSHVAHGPAPSHVAHGPAPSHVARGPMPSRHFAGRAYHGQVAWEGGRWHHERRHGRYGWWWDVGGASYFYPQPVEGPPDYVSDVEIIDDPYGYPPPVAYAPPPPPPPAAPDPAASAVGGAIVGGLLGGLISGRPEGAVAGAIAGGATGAIVGAQAASRPGYYWSQGDCYYRYPSGQYRAVDPDYCN